MKIPLARALKTAARNQERKYGVASKLSQRLYVCGWGMRHGGWEPPGRPTPKPSPGPWQQRFSALPPFVFGSY